MREAADDHGKRDAEDQHGLLHHVLAQQILGHGRQVDGRQPEARDHQPGDQPGPGGRKPLQSRRGRGGIPEADADAREHQRAAQLAVDARDRLQQCGNRFLVAVDGNYERVAGRHRLHAAATASTSASASKWPFTYQT